MMQGSNQNYKNPISGVKRTFFYNESSHILQPPM